MERAISKSSSSPYSNGLPGNWSPPQYGDIFQPIPIGFTLAIFSYRNNGMASGHRSASMVPKVSRTIQNMSSRSWDHNLILTMVLYICTMNSTPSERDERGMRLNIQPGLNQHHQQQRTSSIHSSRNRIFNLPSSSSDWFHGRKVLLGAGLDSMAAINLSTGCTGDMHSHHTTTIKRKFGIPLLSAYRQSHRTILQLDISLPSKRIRDSNTSLSPRRNGHRMKSELDITPF